MNDKASFFAGTFAGIIAGLMLSMAFMTPNAIWHRQAVERGYAEHDSKTGKWKWLEPTQPTQPK